jgi:microcystin-dependent protein
VDDFTGKIEMFAGEVAPPGYLFCDGSLVSRESYPLLSQMVGVTYGGNQTQFALPDLRSINHAGQKHWPANEPRVIICMNGRSPLV